MNAIKALAVMALTSFAVSNAANTQASPENQRVFEVSPEPLNKDLYPERVTPFPNGVTGHADIVYQTIPGFRPLRLDLYVKETPAMAKPLVIYIHGGGWSTGHTRQLGPIVNASGMLASLAAEGFVVASIEYRLSGEARFPAQIQDVRSAIRFLKSNAAKYGIDANHVGVWGPSAGGHLAALVALSCGVAAFDQKPEAPHSECVQAAAVWYGVFDFPSFAQQNKDGAIKALLGCQTQCEEAQLKAASPLTYLDPSDPPMLLIHGDADKVVSVAQSNTAFARMKALGLKVNEIVIPGVDHSLIGANVEQTRSAMLGALNRTFDFFHETLSPKK